MDKTLTAFALLAATAAAALWYQRPDSAGAQHARVSIREVRSEPPPADGVRAQEQRMWSLVNRDRRDVRYVLETRGRAVELHWDERLAEVARAHSADMASRGFFDHVNPDGISPSERVAMAGIPWTATAENIALFDTVEGAQRAFMAEPAFEPNHRANILDPETTHVGVGVVRASDGRLFITQEFRRAP